MFFHRLDELNIMDTLINYISDDSLETKLKIEQLEEHIKKMIDVFVAYHRTLSSEIRRGEKDGSITCSLSDYEYFNISMILYFGSGDFLKIKQFRKTGQDIVNNVILLLEKILTDQIQLN